MAGRCGGPSFCSPAPSGSCCIGSVDYLFYQDEFGGRMGAEEFARILPRAVRHVKWLCGNPDLVGASAESVLCWKRAICAAAEAFYEWDEDRKGAVSLGDYKVTRYLEDRETTARDEATAAATRELFGTGALFGGVG